MQSSVETTVVINDCDNSPDTSIVVNALFEQIPAVSVVIDQQYSSVNVHLFLNGERTIFKP